MRRHWLSLAVAAAAWTVAGAGGNDVISRLLDTPAAQIDSRLPMQPLGRWLGSQLPPGATPVFQTGPCRDRAGTCVRIRVDIVSRARVLRLDYAVDPPRFLGGTVEAPDGATPQAIQSLAALPRRLAAPMRPNPLDCPHNTRNMLRDTSDAVQEWCIDNAGRRQGPARSWYSTGRYLMWRGRYQDDKRAGLWTLCDRSERCRTRPYP